MKIIKKIFIPLFIFFIFIFIYMTKAIDFKSLFYFDEIAWVGRGYYLDLLIKKDFKNDYWQQYLVDGDPKLTSYIYGLTVFPDYLKKKKQQKNNNYDMFNYLIDNKLNPFNYYGGILINPILYNKYETYSLNRKLDNFDAQKSDSKTFLTLIKRYGNEFRKTTSLIFKARHASVFILSLTMVVVYLIFLTMFENAFLSLVGSIFYGLSPLILKYGLIAYTEPFFLFFINLGILIILKIFIDKKYQLFWVILFTLVVALTNQVKLNGIILLIIHLIILVFRFLLSNKYKSSNFKKIFINIWLVIHLVLYFYILLDPFLHKNPIKKIFFQYQFTYMIAKGQQITTPKESLKTVKSRLYYIDDYFFGEENSLKLYKNIFVLGLIISIIKLIKSKKLTKENLMLIIFLGFFIPLLFFLMLSWDRYLIQIVFFIYYFYFQGILFIYKIIKHYLNVLNHDLNNYPNL